MPEDAYADDRTKPCTEGRLARFYKWKIKCLSSVTATAIRLKSPMPNSNVTDTSTSSPETHDVYRYGGNTSAMVTRFMATLGFWTFGILGLIVGIYCLSMLVIVPTFALENDAWNRADNPCALANGLFCLALGAIAVYGALGSDRRRAAVIVIAIVASALDGLYDLGLFDA